MLEFWLVAFGLYLIIEGLVPVINPDQFKQFLVSVSEMPSEHLRLIGLSSMIVGALIITVAR